VCPVARNNNALFLELLTCEINLTLCCKYDNVQGIYVKLQKQLSKLKKNISEKIYDFRDIRDTFRDVGQSFNFRDGWSPYFEISNIH
jgi:hypothetical protein